MKSKAKRVLKKIYKHTGITAACEICRKGSAEFQLWLQALWCHTNRECKSKEDEESLNRSPILQYVVQVPDVSLTSGLCLLPSFLKFH